MPELVLPQRILKTFLWCEQQPRELQEPLKSCVSSWGQRTRHRRKASETRLQGRGFEQAGRSGRSTAALILSVFP